MKKFGFICSAYTSDLLKEYLRQSSGFKLLKKDELHLGTPLWPHRGTAKQLRYIEDRMLERIQSWKVNTLSQAGRAVLIKSILSAVLAHLMATALLQKSVLKRINAIQSAFWWGESLNKRKIHLCNWEVMKLHKHKGGWELGSRRATTELPSWRLLGT